MTLEEYIERASAEGASDVHLAAGMPPGFRIDGRLIPMQEEKLTAEECWEYAEELAAERIESLKEIGELDAARTFACGRRTRINLFFQQGSPAAAIRLLSNRIPELEELGLPPAVSTLPGLRRGLVIVTGETGSGKSTTLASLLHRINQAAESRIITLEDPIEYVHTPDRCMISQREIGSDTRSYASGLRAILREDPDVILIGEMRDLETIQTALTAAETGHLVFATLHTMSAPDAIDRIVDVFPEERQKQIRMQLSMTLQAVLAQQLLVRKGGKGRVAACEIMMVNSAIRNLIREGKTPQIANALATSAADGSLTMDNALIALVRKGDISAETAAAAARDPDMVKRNARF